MKKKIVILCIGLLLGSSFFCFSDSAHQTVFEEAQAAYQKGAFQDSLQKFLRLTQSGLISPEVYYNTANCYYKLGKIGKAILFYERAHDIQKRDEDIHTNLLIAKKQIKDRWKDISKPFLQSMLSLITENFSLWELTLSNVVLLWILLILAALKLQGKKNRIMQFFFVLFIPMLILCSISLFSALQEKHSHRAILTEKIVSARSGPGKSFPATLTLHEGTSLRIIGQNGIWSKALFPNDTIGWVKSKTYEFV